MATRSKPRPKRRAAARAPRAATPPPITSEAEAPMDAERAVRHRTAPGLALRDVEDAAGFLRELGLLVQTPHPYLPSLFAAAQGKPAKPGAGGFGQWPEHAWSWAGELAERSDVLLTKVILSKRTLVERRLWPALDAAVRGREPQGPDARAITDALEKQGATRTDELRRLIDREGSAGQKRYEKAMGQLESNGIVLCRPVLVDTHKHVGLAELWTARFPSAIGKSKGVGEFVRAAVEAAGAVPAREVLKWFSWPQTEVARALEALGVAGKVR
jgi:hypothetical protein